MKIARPHLQIAALLMMSAAIANGQGNKKSGAATPSAPVSNSASSASAPSSSAAIESQVLAIGGLERIATMIAENVCPNLPDNGTVVIFDQTSFASLQAYESFIANAGAVVSLYESLLPDDSGDPSIPDKKESLILS